MQGAGPDVSRGVSAVCRGTNGGSGQGSGHALLHLCFLCKGCAAGSGHCPLHLAPLPVHRTASSKHRCCFMPAAAKWCSYGSARLRTFVIPE